MKPGDLSLHLEAYLALKKALGFPLGAREKLLRDFVAFVESNGVGVRGTISAQVAFDWACAVSDRCGISGKVARLSVARQFLFHLSAVVPDLEVPSATLLARPRRRKPFLFSTEEISRLLKAALSLRPQGSLRPHTLSTLLGLLASSGIRPGEALKLTVRDVLLDLDPPRLQIHKAKFHKSRLVPIHQTVADQLRQYTELRRRLNYDGLSDSFFVSEQGGRLSYRALNHTFQKLVRGLEIQTKDGSRRPSLNSLRHGFAVARIRVWYQQGVDVRAHLPELSVYLGHLEPAHTYWYLTATPELLSEAARSFAAYAITGGEQ
jgi:integrase/recombinase XerD